MGGNLSQMLEHGRWWNAREALVNQKYYGIYNQDNLQILLDEQYKTQVALNALKVDFRTEPSDVPLINTLAIPSSHEGVLNMNKPLIVSVIGMPNAGKSSRLKEFHDFAEPELRGLIVKPGGERAVEVKNYLDSIDAFTFERQITLQRRLQYADYLETVKNLANRESDIDYTVMFDRDWTDTPMAYANLLFGRLGPDVDIVNAGSVKKGLDSMQDANVLVVSLLSTPQESVHREGPRDTPGRVMQLPFLQVLYEQYLRYHYEMLAYKKVFGEPRPFFYTALDASNESWDVYRAIEKTLLTVSMLPKDKKIPSIVKIISV